MKKSKKKPCPTLCFGYFNMKSVYSPNSYFDIFWSCLFIILFPTFA